jgi:hypothetical protein
MPPTPKEWEMGESGPVRIELSEDEALVLFDWPSRFNDRKDVDFPGQAEQRLVRHSELLATPRSSVPVP